MSSEEVKNTATQITLNAQYVKDLSFENPNAPMSLMQTNPKMELSLNVGANNIEQDAYEVVMYINAKAIKDDKTLFIVDLTYSGIFTLTNIDENQLEQILLIYCPNILFPYARRIVSDVTRDGGFQPLMIDPIDFASLYDKRNQQTETSTILQ